MSTEYPTIFSCENEQLMGIFHKGDKDQTRGVLVVVGGPQYRVGSHRQFVLFARHMAKQGVPVFRFDYRGMGDSGGADITFEDCTPDIIAATEHFQKEFPHLREVVLFGLCDAASASLMAVNVLPSVTGMILLNPWVYSPEGEAKTLVKHYYLARLKDLEFWKKLVSGRFEFLTSIRSFFANLIAGMSSSEKATQEELPYQERMLQGFKDFAGRVLLVTSGDDLTALQFRDMVKSSAHWRDVLARDSVTDRHMPDANHTFSTKKTRNQLLENISEWWSEW